jgi:hypothetical protein
LQNKRGRLYLHKDQSAWNSVLSAALISRAVNSALR